MIKLKFKVGDKVEYCQQKFEVGEIKTSTRQIYLWSNHEDFDGAIGKLSPSSKGYKYSYVTSFLDEVKLIKKEVVKTEFKVGDEVKFKDYEEYGDYRSHEGQTATIIERIEDIDSEFDWRVRWQDTCTSSVAETNLIKKGENTMTKKVWYITIIDKSKDKIVAEETLIDGIEEKDVCAKISIKLAEKLKSFKFEDLYYIVECIGSYEVEKKKE